jgi:hypothetical protein
MGKLVSPATGRDRVYLLGQMYHKSHKVVKSRPEAHKAKHADVELPIDNQSLALVRHDEPSPRREFDAGAGLLPRSR